MSEETKNAANEKDLPEPQDPTTENRPEEVPPEISRRRILGGIAFTGLAAPIALGAAEQSKLLLSMMQGKVKAAKIVAKAVAAAAGVADGDCDVPGMLYHDDGKDCYNTAKFACGGPSSGGAGFVCDGDWDDDFECYGDFDCKNYFWCMDSFDPEDCPTDFVCTPIERYFDDDGGGPTGLPKPGIEPVEPVEPKPVDGN